MKKNILKIGLLSLITITSLSLNSCRDAIYIEQDGEVNDEKFFSNVNNLRKFLIGDVYPNADNTTSILASSIYTDELSVGTSNGGSNINKFRFFLDSTDDLASTIWVNNYKLINRVVRLLHGAKRIVPSSQEVQEYNKILAEARALRALAYLQLETFFSEDMTNPNALGVMILNEVPNTSTQLPRSTNAEVYAVIEDDLNFAEQYLDQSNRYLASKDLINAIRARLNLYRGKYDDAKRYAQAVINSSNLTLVTALSGGTITPQSTNWNDEFYKDASISPYRQMWSDNSQGEIIFALSRPLSGSYIEVGRLYNTNKSDIDGNPIWEMGRNLFNILNTSSDDIRRYAFIDPTSKIDSNYLTNENRQQDILIIDKYPGKGTNPLRNDLKIFRLSEMYLILAEAEAEAGNLSQAAGYIAQIRTARSISGNVTTPIYSSKQSAFSDILLERRKELAFEGHRYIDLKRMADKAGVVMDRNQTDDNFGFTVTNLPNNSYKYTLPIPASEIAGNKNIQQNKNY